MIIATPPGGSRGSTAVDFEALLVVFEPLWLAASVPEPDAAAVPDALAAAVSEALAAALVASLPDAAAVLAAVSLAAADVAFAFCLRSINPSTPSSSESAHVAADNVANSRQKATTDWKRPAAFMVGYTRSERGCDRCVREAGSGG